MQRRTLAGNIRTMSRLSDARGRHSAATFHRDVFGLTVHNDRMTTAPRPSDNSQDILIRLEDLVADPEAARRILDDVFEREAKGTLVTHTHKDVLARLAKLGVFPSRKR
jgi:hypothetical protein